MHDSPTEVSPLSKEHIKTHERHIPAPPLVPCCVDLLLSSRANQSQGDIVCLVRMQVVVALGTRWK